MFRDKAKDGTTRITGGAMTLLDVYPVGSIYMAVTPTDPGTFFGGTWEAWGEGRVPVGIDSGDVDFDTVEETGGAKTHTLTTAEMPSHDHASNENGFNLIYYTGSGGTVSTPAGTSATGDGGLGKTSDTGGGGAHNNLQPYITCYMWKRTA